MIQLRHHSGVHTLASEQFLPMSVDEAWDFFSSPRNLTKITPAYMGFNITSQLVGKIYAGQIITYKIALSPRIPASWVTEITHVKEGEYFIDEQRYGPYSMWHHEHRFTAVDGGVLVSDKVIYKVPLGPIGEIVDRVYIRKQLKGIFEYREKALDEMFPVDVSLSSLSIVKERVG